MPNLKQGEIRVDRLAVNWKKYPLLVIGTPVIPLPGALELPISAIGVPDSIPLHDFYVLVCLPAAQAEAALARLADAGLPPEQALAWLPAGQGPVGAFQPWTGQLEVVESESPDDIRARLLGKLEGQRQKKLNYALQEASDRGLSRHFNEAELLRVLDGVRIAHSLACAFSLPPLSHSLALRACLERSAAAPGPWATDSAPERLVVECAFLFLECQEKGASFREQLKEKSAALPFRVRSELLHHIETGLGFLVGGKNHAA